MNSDELTDLKQFITATVSQQTADLDDRIERIFDKKFDEKLDQKFELFARTISEIIEASNKAANSQLVDHEKRISRLEATAS